MYRYTAVKNKQHNQKFKQKHLKVKAGPVKKKNNNPSSKVNKKNNKNNKVKEDNFNRQPIFVWWIKLLKWGINIFLGLVFIYLIYLIYLITINIFLPQIFSLNEEKNLLLVGSTINNRAKDLYLIKLSPQNNNMMVTEISGDLLVPVSGGYGYYQLGSLAPFLQFETDDLEQIKGAYNFALKKIVDEVYFFPEMSKIEKKEDLEVVFFDLIKKDLINTGVLNMDYLKIYFEMRANNNLIMNELTIFNEKGADGLGVNKEKLVNCPVVLVNAAGVNGLVSKVSEMLEINGFLVVNWENSPMIEEKSRIYYDESEVDCVKVVEVMKKIFPMIEEVKGDGGEQAKKNRAKTLIVLGQEVAN